MNALLHGDLLADLHLAARLKDALHIGGATASARGGGRAFALHLCTDRVVISNEELIRDGAGMLRKLPECTWGDSGTTITQRVRARAGRAV